MITTACHLRLRSQISRLGKRSRRITSRFVAPDYVRSLPPIPSASETTQVVETKRPIEDLAAAARKSFGEKLQVADQKDLQSFRLTTEMIEQFKQIAHLARRIAETTKEW